MCGCTKQTVQTIDFILKKAQFFDRFKNLLNERQLKAVNKMFDAGPDGFTGGMNATKYISITKASKLLLQETYNSFRNKVY